MYQTYYLYFTNEKPLYNVSGKRKPVKIKGNPQFLITRGAD